MNAWKRTVLLVVLSRWIGIGYANEEMTVELPGGATMDFVWIEPGTFTMGTTEEQGQLLHSQDLWNNYFENEYPAHEVTITQGFWLGKYEITQRQWVWVMDTRPWREQEAVQSHPTHPAVYISWHDVQAFIHELNAATGDSLYRLPTEVEWEYACRAGTITLWSFGDDAEPLGDYAWYRKNAWDVGLQYAQPIGMKLPNPWGLYDMYGSVWEWVQDGGYRVYTSAAQVDPSPSVGSGRGRRGGSFDFYAKWTRSATRNGYTPEHSYYNIGARLLRMGPPMTPVAPESWGRVKGGY